MVLGYSNFSHYCHAIELLKKNKKPVVQNKQALFNFILEKVGLQYAIEAISPDNPKDFIILAWSENKENIQKNILCGFLYDLERKNKAKYETLLCQCLPIILNNYYKASNNTIFTKLIEKIPAKNFKDLIHTLSEKNKSNKNALFLMMEALLVSTTDKLSPSRINFITDCFIRLIERIPANNFKDFIHTLSDHILSDDTSYMENKWNINALFLMINALYSAAEHNDPIQAKVIMDCFIRLIERIPADNFKDFIQALSVKNTSNENALLYMMCALHHLALKNSTQLKSITDYFIRLIEKIPAKNFKDFTQLLPEKNKDGRNALFFMTQALRLAAENNPPQVNLITGCFIVLFKKTSADNFKDFGNDKSFFEVFEPGNFLDKKSSDSVKLSFYKIILHFTNIFKTKKYGFFSSEAAWPSDFENAEKIKEIYHNMFDFFREKKYNEIDPELLKIFLETARSKEYLRDYCVTKMKTDSKFYEQHILNTDSAIATFVNGQRGFIKTDKTATRLALEATYEKQIKSDQSPRSEECVRL